MELRERKPFLEVGANNWIRSGKYGLTLRSWHPDEMVHSCSKAATILFIASDCRSKITFLTR